MGVREIAASTAAIIIGCFLSCFIILHMLIAFLMSPGTWFWKRRHEVPACLNDPDLGTHNFVHLENVRLHYVAAGDEDKPLMLLLHGFPEFWYSWRHQIREFKKDYRVVAVDQRGYSESDRPSGVHNYKIIDMADDVKQLVPALGYKSCVLVGHDWGGGIAWTVAGLYPELVDKLIIMNCPHPLSFHGHIVSNIKQLMKSWYLFFFGIPLLPELYCCMKDKQMLEHNLTGPKMGVKCTKLTPEDLEAYKYTFQTIGCFTGPINYMRALIRTAHPRQRRISAPTLLVWGCQDGVFDTGLVSKAEQYVESLTIKMIEEASHWVQMDCPDIVNAHMKDFLQ